MADLTSIPACRAFAENLLRHLHDEVLQSRCSIWFPYHGWYSTLPQSFPPKFSFCLNPPFHFESLVFHLNCLSPTSNSINPSSLIQTSLSDASDDINLPRHFHVIAMRSPSSIIRIDVFDARWVQYTAENVVLDFRFPVRRNAGFPCAWMMWKEVEIQKAGFPLS